MARQIVELNGKKYDTETGQLIPGGADQAPPKKKPGRTLDGITPSRNIQIKRAFYNKQPKNIPVRHIVSSERIHLKPKRSVTLMRSSVKKPNNQTPTPINSAKQPRSLIDQNRLQRAMQHQRSQLIDKYNRDGNVSSETKQVAKQHRHIPLQQSPEEVNSQPNFNSRQNNPTSQPDESNQQPSAGLFEDAIANAKSHTAQPIKLPKPKTKLAPASMVLAILLLGGFITYQNTYNLSMRLAGSRAGISARLPGYKPDGFSISGRIAYSPGQVDIDYQSTSDDRRFSLTQEKTNWDEAQMVNNLFRQNSQSYQTYQSQDNNIYIYGEHNATWIDNGIRYTITGKSALTSDQLVKIAGSL